MAESSSTHLWLERFPALKNMQPEHWDIARAAVMFPVLEAGAAAYRQNDDCPNYVMCIDGLTRAFKLSDQGREVLIYQVSSGDTCLLTTQCLLSGGTFPAESTAVERTQLAAIPAPVFRELMHKSAEFRAFVLDDYARLMSQLFSLVDDLAFATVERRLARRLITEAGDSGAIEKTHQQLAADVGSVREVVSRHLSEWERAGWVSVERGRITIRNRAALAGQRNA